MFDFFLQMFHTLLDLPCLSAALCTSWATKGTVCQ